MADTTTGTNQKDEQRILKSLKKYRRSFDNFMSSDSLPYDSQMTRKNSKFNEIESPFEQQKMEVAGFTLGKENIFHAREKYMQRREWNHSNFFSLAPSK